jgi:hypothetical protein
VRTSQTVGLGPAEVVWYTYKYVCLSLLDERQDAVLALYYQNHCLNRYIMKILTTLFLFAAPLFAYPGADLKETNLLQLRVPSFEGTVWGDSYASGIASENYIDGRRCLRYDGAYSTLIQADPNNLLPGSGGKLNNVVCSGA